MLFFSDDEYILTDINIINITPLLLTLHIENAENYY